MHWDWVVIFGFALLGGIMGGVWKIIEKLDRVIRLLEIANDQRQPPSDF